MKSKFVFTSPLTFLMHVSGLGFTVHGSQVHFITKKVIQKQIYIYIYSNLYYMFYLTS